jgi:homocysteine S-methyltransferase
VEWNLVRDFHANRLDVLLETEPDLLAIETMPDLTEIDIILNLIAERAPDLSLWVSCTIGEIGVTRVGQPLQDVASRVEGHPSAIAVGINCSATHLIAPTLATIDTELPFVVYPNLGQTWDGASQRWIGEGIAASNVELAEWVERGARIIGGCCGYGTRELRELAHRVESLS